LAALAIADHPDYCEDKYNCMDTHIGCDNPLWDGGFGDNCGENPMVLNLTSGDKEAFLKAMNQNRNQQALGLTPGYLGAVGMAEVSWDQELANLAELYVRQCQNERDICHNTVKYQNSGQTLAVFAENDPTSKNASYYATKSVDSWFAEGDRHGKHYGYMDIINHYHRSNPNYPIDDFLQVVRDESTAVGCAILTFETTFDDGEVETTIFTTCNYARDLPERDGTVYVTGNSTSKCETGISTQYPGLCTVAKNYSESESESP